MEKPNTVAALIEKRRELAARLKQAKAEIKTLHSGIDAIDAMLKLFAPEINGADAKPMRLPVPYAADRVAAGGVQSRRAQSSRTPSNGDGRRLGRSERPSGWPLRPHLRLRCQQVRCRSDYRALVARQAALNGFAALEGAIARQQTCPGSTTVPTISARQVQFDLPSRQYRGDNWGE
jgi:hypothetical protein